MKQPARIALGLLPAALVAAACSASTTSTPERTVHVSRAADGTTVAITDDPAEPENAVCSSYCKQLAKCWQSLPNVDFMKTRDEVLRQCRAEEQGCRTPTTELLCCAFVDDCADFAVCNSRGRDIVSDCKYTLRRPR